MKNGCPIMLTEQPVKTVWTHRYEYQFSITAS